MISEEFTSGGSLVGLSHDKELGLEVHIKENIIFLSTNLIK